MTRISALATRSDHQRICAITSPLIEEKAIDAMRNSRLREVHAFHENEWDPVQRVLNALQTSSYIRPHRHVSSASSESVLLLTGSLAFVTFTDNGAIDESNSALLGGAEGALGVDCRGGIWHTFFALEPNTVVFEIKAGPFDPRTDKEYPTWTPAENTPEGFQYLGTIEDHVCQHFGIPPREWELPIR